MATEDPTFKIPKEVIEPIIKAHVTTAIVAALGGQSALLQEAVSKLLTQKVDNEGKLGGYSASIPWIEWVMGNSIRCAAAAAIEEAVVLHKDAIKAAIIFELKKKNSPLVTQLVQAMTGAMIAAGSSKYRLTVEYKP